MTDPKPQRSALGDALRNTLATAATDAIATKLGGARHTAPVETTTDDDPPPGPDTLTRDDIDTALGCLDAIAGALETIANAVQIAMEAAHKPAAPAHTRPAPR